MTGAIKIDIVFYPPLQRRNGCIPENSKRFVQEREDSPGEFFNFRLILLNARNSLARWLDGCGLRSLARGVAQLCIAHFEFHSRRTSSRFGSKFHALQPLLGDQRSSSL